MTDAEQDKLRKELPDLVTRVAVSGAALIRLVDAAPDLPAVRNSPAMRDARDAFGKIVEWLRRSAGPEDLAKLEGSKAQ